MSELSKFIEHTFLKPETTLTDVRRVCEEAQKHQFHGVCVPPFFVRDARRILGEDGKLKVSTVVAFPMGYTAIASKSEEIKRALDDGADDVDAVINIAAVKSGNWNHVSHDIDSIARATHMRGRTLKLVLECGLLSEAEILRLGELSKEFRITWLSTGTAFHNYPLTVDMVRTLRAAAAPDIKIKAVGDILTAKEARDLLEAGADRIGTSASVAIAGK